MKQGQRSFIIGVSLLAVLVFTGTTWANCWPGMFPDSGRRFLTGEDLKYLEEEELWLARNEIFARHGYAFKTRRGQEFAAELCNYRPIYKNAGRVEALFNTYEKKNIALIIRYEKNMDAGANYTPAVVSPWIFPDSDKRYLSDHELRSLNRDQLWKARNEIYARHGLIFKSKKGRAYTRSLGGYYEGVYTDQNQVLRLLNTYERANINKVMQYE